MKPRVAYQAAKGAAVGLFSSSMAHRAPDELPGLLPGLALLAEGVEEEEGMLRE